MSWVLPHRGLLDDGNFFLTVAPRMEQTSVLSQLVDGEFKTVQRYRNITLVELARRVTEHVATSPQKFRRKLVFDAGDTLGNGLWHLLYEYQQSDMMPGYDLMPCG